ncbi:MAG: YggS family pyridoxal phosphate-dependent enzyme [Flavobacteriaceae bacterium]|nr:MAG: YggS family pyridoxal phosphate-dependent enzyme [Flavobacteriaceae bacterium]
MSIRENLSDLKSCLPSEVTLVAVSKTKPISDILEAYNCGQRIFGENKIQEMQQKYLDLPKDISWHLIGSIQTNKIKYIVDFVDLIHGVDRPKVLEEINKQAQKVGRKVKVLLQMKIAKEDTKHGFDPQELKEYLNSNEILQFQNIQILGLMGMASFTDNHSQIKTEFDQLKSIFEDLKSMNIPHCQMEILSMGMSGDYPIALESGSNMVRIGSSIFGGR